MHGETRTQKNGLDKGTSQGDPISAYLSTLVIEIALLKNQENKTFRGLYIFNHTFLYTAYAEETTSILSDKKSVMKLMKIFNFLSFSV